ncbi:GNAT family N-acetyltransferase [Haloprofundus salinisoli]|uniref:GNAT family N-acetyltransferase n=1 Tax=Haloprofundus salinisoli TaxID=2876193 RepID=UPI001CCBC5D4|nr:GNAT family N-acetyltransferase [Haloprofundus salinisoli]
MFPTEIETDRLTLLRCCRENLPARELYRHVGRDAPAVSELTRYTMWNPHRTLKETHDYLVDIEEQWDEREQATYVVYSRDADGDDDFAGVTNLHLGWKRRSAELGIWLREPFWGRGYSGERAAALFELAFERLDLDLVGAAHQDGNEKSKRAIERYVDAHGGQYDGVLRNWIPKGDEVRDLHRYTVSREQYQESRRSA